MNSESKDNQNNRRQLSIWSGFTFLLLVFFWVLTHFFGTHEVHQSYVKLNQRPLPAKQILEDRRPDDANTVWELIAYPRAPLPFIVSLEVDYGAGMSIWGGPQRHYFFWVPGYHSKTPFWGRQVYGTYEENE
ncbi:MAG: hypothetical protein P1V19_05575 [Gimesia sp.]|nr:hypothetical protein [Gimesia sp.]